MEKELDSKLLIILMYSNLPSNHPADILKNHLSFLYSQLSIDTNCDIILTSDPEKINGFIHSKEYDFVLQVHDEICFHHLDLFLDLIRKIISSENDFVYGRDIKETEQQILLDSSLLLVDCKAFSNECFKIRNTNGNEIYSLVLPKKITAKKFDEKVEYTFVRFQRNNINKYLDSLALFNTYYTFNANSFFISNTESLGPFNPEKIEKIGPLARLVIPASGLLPLRLLKQCDYFRDKDAKPELFIYDTSDLSLKVYETLFSDWNGNDYPEFVHKQSRGIVKSEGLANKQWEDFKALFSDDYERVEWIKNLRSNINSKFLRTNAFTYRFLEAPWNTEHEKGATLISLSNIFNFAPTSWFFSYNYRTNKLNEIISYFKKSAPNNWIYANYSFYDGHCFKPKTILKKAKDIELIEVNKLPWED